MAFDLIGRIKLVDNFSDPMGKIERAVLRSERAMQRMEKEFKDTNSAAMRAAKGNDSLSSATSKATTATSRMEQHMRKAQQSLKIVNEKSSRLSQSLNGLGSAAGGVGKLTGAFAGLAAAIGGAYTANKVFNETIGKAAQFEQSNVIIGAMFNDKALGTQYTKIMDRIAADSPVLDSQAMYANSKSFITVSKDMKQLEKMWSLAERMAAIDPMQGVEGSVFALRELFSGDAVSMVERFEMPRAVMNDIKKMGLPQQLEELDKYFNKIGMTDRLISDMGDTTLGKWQQIKEKTDVIMRTMGGDALGVISSRLTKVIEGMDAGKLDKFRDMGTQIITNIVNGLDSTATKLWGWFEAIGADPAFKSKTTLFGKVEFIIADVYDRFVKWLDVSGGAQIGAVTERLFGIINENILTKDGAVLEAAGALGTKIGAGVISGAQSYIADNWYKMIAKSIDNPMTKWIADPIKAGARVLKIHQQSKSHNSGLDRVPYNGYQATLHKDETVLKREDAQQWRQQKGGNGGVNVTIQNMQVRKESDIEEIAYLLSRKIEMEAAQIS